MGTGFKGIPVKVTAANGEVFDLQSQGAAIRYVRSVLERTPWALRVFDELYVRAGEAEAVDSALKRVKGDLALELSRQRATPGEGYGGPCAEYRAGIRDGLRIAGCAVEGVRHAEKLKRQAGAPPAPVCLEEVNLLEFLSQAALDVKAAALAIEPPSMGSAVQCDVAHVMCTVFKVAAIKMRGALADAEQRRMGSKEQKEGGAC